MDILTHHLHGLDAKSFDDDLRQAVLTEGDRVRRSAGALVGATLEQIRRWADRAGVTGSDRIATFDSLDVDDGQALIELAVADASSRATLGRYTDADRAAFDRAMDSWAALTGALGLLVGGECHSSLVIDLDAAAIVTVVSDVDTSAAGEIGDVFQLASGTGPDPTFAGDMNAAADLHDRCHEYGLLWPPTGL